MKGYSIFIEKEPDTSVQWFAGLYRVILMEDGGCMMNTVGLFFAPELARIFAKALFSRVGSITGLDGADEWQRRVKGSHKKGE